MSAFFFNSLFSTSNNDRLIWAILRKTNEEKTQLEDSVSSLGFTVDSFAVSTFEISSVVCSDIVGVGLGISSSDFADGGVGDLIAGEFRCCSSSYSLIKRFLSGWALVEETEVVGETDEMGDGLLRFDVWSTLVGKDDSCCVSDDDESDYERK